MCNDTCFAAAWSSKNEQWALAMSDRLALWLCQMLQQIIAQVVLFRCSGTAASINLFAPSS